MLCFIFSPVGRITCFPTLFVAFATLTFHYLLRRNILTRALPSEQLCAQLLPATKNCSSCKMLRDLRLLSTISVHVPLLLATL